MQTFILIEILGILMIGTGITAKIIYIEIKRAKERESKGKDKILKTKLHEALVGLYKERYKKTRL